MDPTDTEILKLLEQDGRTSYAAIGREVGLSTAAVKRRVERLEADQIIRGYSARVDYTKLGLVLEAFIELRFTGSLATEDIWKSTENIPEIQAVYTTAGDVDALVHARARDVSHVSDLLGELRRKRQIIGTRTLIVMETRTRATG